MGERLRLVARLLEGEKMAELCREFDISRKTGYKIFQRYKGTLGLDGLTDRNKLPKPIEALIVRLKREHPSWGAPKIREKAFSGIAIALVAATRRVRMLQLTPIDDRRSR